MHCHFVGGIHEAVLCCNVLLWVVVATVAAAAAAVVANGKCNMTIWNNNVVDRLNGTNRVVVCICFLPRTLNTRRIKSIADQAT